MLGQSRGMNKTLNQLSETALSLAEDAVEMAVDSASDIASDAVDLAGDLAVPAIAYGTKKILSSRVVLAAIVVGGAVAGLFVWRRRSGEEETVTSNIPTVSDRSPASS